MKEFVQCQPGSVGTGPLGRFVSVGQPGLVAYPLSKPGRSGSPARHGLLSWNP